MADDSTPKSYQPDQVVLDLFGSTMEGFAPGTMLEYEGDEDEIVKVVGTTGEVAISRVNNPCALLTVRLLQTSNSNDVLSAQRVLGKRAPGLAGVGPMQLRDLEGRTIVDGRAIVVKAPKITMDREAKEREWKLLVIETSRQDGGNIQAGT